MSPSVSVRPAAARAMIGPRSPEAIAGAANARRIRRQRDGRARRPLVRARPAVRIDSMQQRGAQARIDPGLGRAGVGGIDRQSLDQLFARRPGRALQHLQMRPRRFRIDVVGGDRRNAAPIVDARLQPAGAARRGSDWAAPGYSFPARRSGAPPRWSKDAPRPWAPATSAMRVPGLGRKFCTMISWICPWASCRSRNASSASIRSRRVSPMPMRMPGGEGHPLLPRHADGREPRRRDPCRASHDAALPARRGGARRSPASRPARSRLCAARQDRAHRAGPD